MKINLKKLKVKLNKKNIIILSGISAVLIFVAILFAATNSDFFTAYSDDISFSQDGNAVVSSSDGVSVSFTGNDIITVKSFSSRMFVLTEKLLICVSPGGEIKYTKVHNFANPAIAVSNKYGIVFNRNSDEYMIFTKRGIICEGKAEDENDIIAADINDEGIFALSTKSDNSACRVYQHNKKGERRYIWACGEEYVVCLDISSNGEKIACGAIGASGGEILSKTYLLDIFSDTAQCEFTAAGESIVSVNFTGKNIISMFSKKRLVYDIEAAKGAPEKSEFSSSAVCFFTDSSGNSAVTTEDVSTFAKTKLTVYSAKNEVKFTSTLGGSVSDVLIKGKNALVASENTVFEISSSGIKNQYTADFDIEGIVICSGDVYVFSSGILKELK